MILVFGNKNQIKLQTNKQSINCSEFKMNEHQEAHQTDDNPQKQIKPSKQQYYKENSLKGSIVKSVYQSSESIEQLINFFKNYHPNEQYIDIKRLHQSVHLKLKKYKQSVYYGEFVNGKRHGDGLMVYNQGVSFLSSKSIDLISNQELKFRIYEGQWENDYKHGKGIQKFANGTVYQGFYVNGKPEGVGRYAWPNGEFYEGEWLNGMKHGSGMWKGAKGDSYVGEWKFGKADGYGVHTWINGDRYQGEFKDSLKHGEGLQKFANGDIYKGFYSEGKPSGFGQYYWTNGSYFKGTFKSGLRSGHGIWKKGHGNTDKYEGQYVNDKKSGYGIFTWASGNVYKGNYENDSRNGYGEMYWMDGSFYKGEWWNGIQHGRGEIYVPGEGVKKGIFQNNTLVSIQEEYSNYNQMPKHINNQMPRNDLHESKQFSHKSYQNHQTKTRQTFRSRAYSTNPKNSKQSTRPIKHISNDNQARVFKLVDVKSNSKNVLAPKDESFHSTISNNTKGFIRFGNSVNKRKENSKSIESEGKKDRIMHSAFYMHKFHNEMERNGKNGIRTSQFDRTMQY